MAVTIPSIEETAREIRDLYRALIPGLSTGPDSIAYRDSLVLAGAVHGLAQDLDAVNRDAVPTTAEGAALDGWGDVVQVARKGATTATGALALRLTGTPSTVVSAGLTAIDRTTGTTVLTSTGVTLDANGQGDVSVDTVDTGDGLGVGAAANLPAGATLDLSSPPAGVNPACSLVVALSGGEDAETDGAYRERIVNRFSLPPQGGTRNDFEQIALLTEGVDAAYACPVRNGLGSVDVVALRDGEGAARVITAGMKTDVEADLVAFKPLPSVVRVLDVTTEVVDTELLLTPLSGYGMDWDDSTAIEVQGYASPTRTVTATADLPADLAVGDRVVFDDDGRVFTVTAIPASDEFRFSSNDPDALAYAPTAGVKVYAGGPLTEPVRQAVLNGYVAPDGSTIPGINQLGPANEEGRYGDWIDTVEEARLAAAALSVAGVYRVTVASLDVDGTPSSPIARPSDPATPGALPEETTSIGLIVAGVALVRRDHA